MAHTRCEPACGVGPEAALGTWDQSCPRGGNAMHFGIGLPHFRQVASTEAIGTVAQAAEALGFDSVWVSDHIVVPHSAIPRFGQPP